MDDTTPLQDFSGYNRVGSIVGGTPTHMPALVKGAQWSPVLTSAITAEYTTSVFTQGREKQPFSLMATVYPIKLTTDSVQQILSNSGQYDGLSINGTVVSFTTQYVTTGEARCSYDIQFPRAVNIVGIHTESKNSLFVDGELVDEIDITPAQQADIFASTNGKLYSGLTTSTSKLAINAVGVYSYSLTQSAIRSLHRTARDMPNGRDMTAMFNGEMVPVSKTLADIFLDQWWQTEEDWKTGTFQGATTTNDQLTPQFDGATSITGKWFGNVILTTVDSATIFGVNLDWEGGGATVEVSLDGAAWSAVTRGVNVSIIPPGFNPTNQQLIVRVTFAGGIVDDPSYLDNLNVVVLRTATSPLAFRTITNSLAYQQRDYSPPQMHEQWGTQIQASGSITIGPDASDAAMHPRTIELWIKKLNTTNPTINVTGTTYQNGVAASTTLPVGEWTLFHVVASADFTSNVVITGPAQVGQIIYYETQLTAGQVAEIAAAYSNAVSLRATDTSVIGVTQSTDAANIYAHDWAITGAG
jgi:hypothetical protein